jgi:hypothetical protein
LQNVDAASFEEGTYVPPGMKTFAERYGDGGLVVQGRDAGDVFGEERLFDEERVVWF